MFIDVNQPEAYKYAIKTPDGVTIRRVQAVDTDKGWYEQIQTDSGGHIIYDDNGRPAIHRINESFVLYEIVGQDVEGEPIYKPITNC